MNSNKMIYDINEKPKKIQEWILYTLQMVLAVFVATVLIANICKTPISSCLFGAMIGTIVYQIISGFKSPMFISSCGATCSAVIGALTLPGVSNQNYLMVFIGGAMIAVLYGIFGLLFKFYGSNFINKLLPPSIVGSITLVIGLNLATYNVTYTHNSNIWEVIVSLSTMFVVALSSHYFKGFLKTIPFLFGIAFGYVFCLILKLCGIDILSFESFDTTTWKWVPDFVFLKWNSGDFSWANLGQTALLFLPVSLCAICEHISDHKTLGNIIGHDLMKEPGLHRTLLGDGVASMIGTGICGLPNTSYGESIATIGFSKVSSVWITFAAAITIGLMSFVAPVSAFIQSIPSAVFSGCSIILYGYIASSGLKTLKDSSVDLNDNKNLTIVSVVLCIGVSGIFLFTNSFTGVSLAMIVGIILNLILVEKKKPEVIDHPDGIEESRPELITEENEANIEYELEKQTISENEDSFLDELFAMKNKLY